jgi:hypothetical protein
MLINTPLQRGGTDGETTSTVSTVYHRIPLARSSMDRRARFLHPPFCARHLHSELCILHSIDALTRELKLNTNGKQMLAAVEKAGLI